jgi:hypothetical protein
MTRFKRFLISLLLLPVFGMLSIEGDGGEGSGSETTDTGRPADMSQSEWDNLLPGEQASYKITDEQIEGEEANELDEEDLDAVLEGEEGEKTAEQIAAEATEAARVAALTPEEKAAEEASAAAAAEAEKNKPAVTILSDEDLLAFRPTVADSEVPLPDTVPDELQTKLDDIDARIDALEEKFDAGDLDRTELRTQKRVIEKERETVNREILRSQIIARDNAKEDVIWRKEQTAFLNARPNEYRELETDGKTPTDRAQMIYAALVNQVSKLNADPANATKSGMQILVMADKAVRTALGLPAVTGKVPAAKPAKVAAPAAPIPNKPNLSQLPAAGEHDADPFAYLDRITDPFAKEEALGKLTDAQLSNYLSGARA